MTIRGRSVTQGLKFQGKGDVPDQPFTRDCSFVPKQWHIAYHHFDRNLKTLVNTTDFCFNFQPVSEVDDFAKLDVRLRG